VLHGVAEALATKAGQGGIEQLLVFVAHGNEAERLLFNDGVGPSQYFDQGLHRAGGGIQPQFGKQAHRTFSRQAGGSAGGRQLVQHGGNLAIVGYKHYLRLIGDAHAGSPHVALRLGKVCHARILPLAGRGFQITEGR